MIDAANRRPPQPEVPPPARAGELLRLARQARGWPQLELALVLGVSQRHVSFVEVGRARPSRQLILEWMAATSAPDSLRDAALQLSGLAPGQPSPIRCRDVALADEPLRRLLAVECALPIALFDDDWKMLGINATGEWLAPLVMDRYWDKLEYRAAGLDMVDAVGDDDGLLCRAVNAPEAGRSLLDQLTQEAWLHPALAPRAERLREALSRRFGGSAGAPAGDEGDRPPRRFVFDTGLGELSFYPLQLACPPAVAGAMKVRMEQWVPADARTARALHERPIPAARLPKLSRPADRRSRRSA